MNHFSNMAHRQQHAPALPDRPAAAQEADDQQHAAHSDQQVADVDQLRQPGRSALHLIQQTQQRTTVHLHPDPHAQDGRTCNLQERRGKKEGRGIKGWRNMVE